LFADSLGDKKGFELQVAGFLDKLAFESPFGPDDKSMTYDAVAPGVLVSDGVQPYLHGFAAVVSFVLRATCTPDPGLRASSQREAKRTNASRAALSIHQFTPSAGGLFLVDAFRDSMKKYKTIELTAAKKHHTE
jgi:hypothetical protein